MQICPKRFRDIGWPSMLFHFSIPLFSLLSPSLMILLESCKIPILGGTGEGKRRRGRRKRQRKGVVALQPVSQVREKWNWKNEWLIIPSEMASKLVEKEPKYSFLYDDTKYLTTSRFDSPFPNCFGRSYLIRAKI